MSLQGLIVASVAALLVGCASLPPPAANPTSQAFDDVAQTTLARIAAASAPAAPASGPELSGFRPLPEGEFAYDARIALARRAERSLDVQYYLIQNDPLGRMLLRELRDAAQRGVRVRLLVDDLYAAGLDDLLVGLAAQPNAQVRIYNPLPARSGPFLGRIVFSLHQFGRINHRMHNKLFIADNSFSVSGGRNIAAEYFMRSEQANFVDLDMLASGPVVREFSKVFDRYWNSERVYPIERVTYVAERDGEALRQRFDELVRDADPAVVPRERDVLRRPALSRQLERGVVDGQMYASARVIADNPDKIVTGTPGNRDPNTVLENVVALFGMGRREVLILSPYFIPDPRGLEMMRRAPANGGRVILMTNSLGATDEPLVYWRYARKREAMLKAGVTIYELSPTLTRKTTEFGQFGKSVGRLHAKLAIVDRRWLYVGSMNLDGRSALYNTEVGLIIDSEEVAADVRRLRIHDEVRSAYRLRLRADGEGVEWVESGDDGREIVHTDEPDGSWSLRLKNWLLSPFVLEEFL
ncbi:MAG TPA: phospholipase D family protein [Burkholderiaceae bacterium]|nr:phospholipase D family protein [Burkholderiaceae bacterium]